MEPDSIDPTVARPAAPGSPLLSSSPVGSFYRVDSSRASFGELRRDAGSLIAAMFLWVSKLARIKLPGSVNDPNVESLEPYGVDPQSIPSDVVARITEMAGQLRPAGFEPVGWYAIIDLFHVTRLYFALLAHPSGATAARVMYRTEGTASTPKVHAHVDFFTALSDGQFLWSTSAKAYLDAPQGCLLNAQPLMEPALLWASHRQQLDVLRTDRRITVAAPTETAPALLERFHATVRDDRLRRRVFAPMSRDEMERAAAADTFRAGAVAGALRDPEILAELDKLQNKRASWGTTVLIFLVSLALFLGAGTRSFFNDRQFLAILVVLLLFHELGHYVAMRLFHYRNLRMFFIPMVGAAVSGQHYNVAGWKKVIVSLAGPLPGIVAGIALGIVGMAHGNDPLLLKSAVVALILNGLNLLPVLPLDGGRVVHALLFVRHPLLDVVFRAVTAVALILITLAIGDRFLMVIGIFMLLTLPVAYRTARIARDLRRSGLPSVSPDSQTIPTDVAQIVIDHVKAAFPVKTNKRVIAQHVLNVYETVNATPPRWPAMIGLGSLHVVALLVSLVMVGVFAIAQQPGGFSWETFARLARRAAQEPQVALDPNGIRTAGVAPIINAAPNALAQPRRYYDEDEDADEASPSSKPSHHSVVLIADFEKRPKAESAFDATIDRLPAGAGAVLFGQTIIVTFAGHAADDDARRSLFDFLETQTKKVFVENDGGPPIRLKCETSSDAEAIALEQSLAGYFSVPVGASFLVPPWHPSDPRTPADRRRHDAARRTYLKLQKATSDLLNAKDDPQAIELQQSIRKANQRGETAEATRLGKQLAERADQTRKKVVDDIRAAGDNDPSVIDLYMSQFDKPGEEYDPERYESFLRKLAQRFGELPDAPAATRPTRSAARFGATGGVQRTGKTLTFHYLNFTDPFDGPPTFVRWLASQGCRDFKYSIVHFDLNEFPGIGGVD